jgi:hypothetical protein
MHKLMAVLFKHAAIAMAAIAWVGPGVSLGLPDIPYRTSFEAPDFLVGALGVSGQDGWTGDGAIQNATPSYVKRGAQSLEIGESAVVSRDLSGPTTGKVYVDGYYHGPTVDATLEPTVLAPSSSVILFHASLGILALDGNGAGGGTWVPTGTPVSTSSLQRITLCQDYDAKTWTLFIDKQLVPGVFGFKDNSISQLTGIDIETPETGKGYLDDFGATTSVPEFFSHALFDFSTEWQDQTPGDQAPPNWDLMPVENKVNASDLDELISRLLE